MMGRAKGTKNERLEDEILLDTLNKLSELGGTAITAKVKLADLAEEQYEQPSRVELDVELNFTQGYRCLLQCSPEQISALADRATIRVRAVGYSIPDQALIFTSFSNSPSHDPGS
jgi:hypothetical protein